MGSPTIFKGNNVKQLKDNLEFFTQRSSDFVRVITNSTADPSSTATNGNAGSILLDQSGNQYVKQDDGTTTNWRRIDKNPSDLLFLNGDWADENNFSSGNNATFNNGGSLVGAISTTTTDPIDGNTSFTYTTNASTSGSANDWVAVNVPIAHGDRGNLLGYIIKYTWDGDSDIILRASDDSNNLLSNGNNVLVNTDNDSANSREGKVVWVQPTTGTDGDSVNIGFQIQSNHGSSSVLKFDLIQLTRDPLKIISAPKCEDSSVRVHTGNGFGSTNTRIRRFSTIVEDRGSDITYADSATDGASFTVNKDGIYHFSLSDNNNSSNAYLGLSLNSSQLTTELLNITAADRLAVQAADSGSGDDYMSCSWSGFLNSGDVVRPHYHSPGNFGSSATAVHMTASKIGEVDPANKFIVAQGNKLHNHFAARIENNGTASILSEGPVSFIQSVTQNTTGRVDIVYTPGFFSVTPSVKATPRLPSFSQTDKIATVFSSSATGCSVVLEDTGSAAFADTDFDVVISRQGADAVEGLGVAAIAGRTHEDEATLRTHTFTGHGSTNTAIRRLGTIVSDTGNGVHWTFTQDATNGDSITILTQGVYNLSISDQHSAGASFGASLNSTQLTTGIQLITAADRLQMADTSATNTTSNCSWEGELQVGDVIRVHTDTTGDGAVMARTAFTFSKKATEPLLGQPSQINALYLKEEQSSNTAGGTFTSGSFQTRVLNTVSGNQSQLIDLTSNAFTLKGPATYKINARAAAFEVNQSQLRLQNTDDATTLILGQNALSSVGGDTSSAHLMGEFRIDDDKTLELQHRCTTTKATNGFGTANNYGNNEVYTEIEIILVKDS